MPKLGEDQVPAGKKNVLHIKEVKNIPLPGLNMPVYKGNAVLNANK